jgi:hypothetical protein
MSEDTAAQPNGIPVLPTIQAIRCCHCQRLHDINEHTFIAVHGNLTIGMNGGLFGNSKCNLVSIFCFGECLEYMFDILRASQKNQTEIAKVKSKQKEVKPSESINASKNPIPELDPNPIPRQSFPPLIPRDSVFFDRR